MTGFLLGVSATFFWSLVNISDKYLINKFRSEGVGALLILSSVFPILLVPIGVIFSTETTAFLHFSASQIALLIFSGTLTTVWMYFYFSALHDEDVTVVAPLFQLTPVIALVLGFLILGELPTSTQLLAALIILIGSVILSYERGSGTVKYKLIAYLALSSGTIALMNVLFKYVALEADFWSSIVWHATGTTTAGVLLFLGNRSYRTSFLHFVHHNLGTGLSFNALNEVLVLIGDTLFAYALLLAPIAIIQSTQAYQPIFVLIMGVVLARLYPAWASEDTGQGALMQKIVGILCVVGGSLLMYLL